MPGLEPRVPRTSQGRPSYLQEFIAFCHPKMFFPIFCFMLWGTFLSPEPDAVKAVLEIVGVTAGVVLGAYKINALYDGGHKTIPDSHMMGWAALGLVIYGVCGLVALYLYGWLVLGLLLLGAFGIVIYNFTHNPLIHNSATYALVWGVFPVVLTYSYQTVSLPTIEVVAFGVAAGIFGRAYTWNHGLRTCGIYETCRRGCKGRVSSNLEGYSVPDTGNPCHSNSIRCGTRLRMPKEINEHAKLRLRMDRWMIAAITVAIVAPGI